MINVFPKAKDLVPQEKKALNLNYNRINKLY
jgi:hypothetical protein